METEIRTRKSPLMQSMIDAVREAIGPYDDETLIRTIGYCRSPEAALKRCAAVLDILPGSPSAEFLATATDAAPVVDEQAADEAAELEALTAIAEFNSTRQQPKRRTRKAVTPPPPGVRKPARRKRMSDREAEGAANQI